MSHDVVSMSKENQAAARLRNACLELMADYGVQACFSTSPFPSQGKPTRSQSKAARVVASVHAGRDGARAVFPRSLQLVA